MDGAGSEAGIEQVADQDARTMSDNFSEVERHGAAFYALPSRAERFWRWCGFCYHLGDLWEEEDPALIGWMQNKTGFHFDWRDRLRILISGRLDVKLTFDMDTPSPDKMRTRVDWHIRRPGD